MEAATNSNRSFASRAVNLAIAAVLLAIVISSGVLIYLYAFSKEETAAERDLEQWKLTVQENPNNSLARANLGVAYTEVGDYDSAIKELKIALDQEPESYTYMERLGHAYRGKGELENAADMFVQSAERYPEGQKDDAYYWAAQCYWEMSNTAAAKDNVEKSIADRDMNWNSHYLFGQILESEGDMEKAKEEYENAAKFNPGDPQLEEAINRLSA